MPTDPTLQERHRPCLRGGTAPALPAGPFCPKADPAGEQSLRGSKGTRLSRNRSPKAIRTPSGLAWGSPPHLLRGAPPHFGPTQLWAPTMATNGPSFKRLSASRMNLAPMRMLLRPRLGQYSNASSPLSPPSLPLRTRGQAAVARLETETKALTPGGGSARDRSRSARAMQQTERVKPKLTARAKTPSAVPVKPWCPLCRGHPRA